MKKQKSSSMKIDDDYTQATKKLIKKTLIGMSAAAVILLLIAFWVFKKVTTPKKDVTLQPSPSAEVLDASSSPSPTAEVSTNPSPSLSSSPTVSPTPTVSPSPSPSKSPSPSPSPAAVSTTTATQSPAPSQSSNSGKTITSQSQLDGYQSNNGSGSTTAEIKVGRNAVSTSRGFVSFDITQIAGASSLDKAVVRIYQQGVSGNPYTVGGDLKIDHLNYGSTFEASDYSTSSISSSFATVSSGPSIGWKEIEVTQNIKGDLTAGRMRSQFRLHFSVEQVGGSGDYALFESADNTLKTGNLPQLVIQTH